MNAERFFTLLGGLFGFLSVAAGAFGSHYLRQRISPDAIALVETAARYQMYHAMALICVAWAVGRWSSATAVAAGWCFAGGTVLFCGSLYLLALIGIRWFGAITPLGGIGLLAGWLALALSAWKRAV